jgi:hypothetical protein
MNPWRDSLPSPAPAPSRDFPALRRVLLFTLPYRMRMIGAMLALLAASARFSTGHRTEPGLFRGPSDWRYPLAAHHRQDSVANGIGSTVSQAVRNALLLVGGLAMLAVTSFKLTLLVLVDRAGRDRPHSTLRSPGAASVARQPGHDPPPSGRMPRRRSTPSARCKLSPTKRRTGPVSGLSRGGMLLFGPPPSGCGDGTISITRRCASG